MRKPKSVGWRNRIVRRGTQPAGQFVANPDQYRVHSHEQEGVLTGLLDRIGWVREVLVSKRSGYVIDGHLRVTAALQRGDETPVPFVEVDVNEHEEAALLASLDPLVEMAGTDPDKLNELVGLLPEDLRDLTAVLRAERKVAKTQVAFTAEDHFRVVVECTDEAQQQALATRLQEEGFVCRLD